MKKAGLIFILAMYLASSTNLYQLAKLPVLVEHYFEHKDKDSQITLWEFLCMHYAHGNVRDSDYDKDMKLPFKSYDGSSSSSMVSYIPKDFSFPIKTPYSCEKSFSVYYEKSISPAYLSCIWQPPKFC